MTATAERVSFYFSAHQDDWQLFMNPPAFQDVLDDTCRCVFVHMTAGDAGLGLGNGGRKHPLYLARENGAEAAIRFMADANERPPAEPTVAITAFNGHPIRCLRYRNTAAYFLRLPDGNPQGTGYAATGFQSLTRLAHGDIATLAAVDDTAAYRGWHDLTATLRAVIAFERGPNATLHLHVPELDPALNLNDHADHYMTAKAALDAAAGMPAQITQQVTHHVGYASGGLPENLGAADRDMKCAVYAVTLAGVLALDHQVSWQHYDQMFVGRNYCRVEDRPRPAAAGGAPIVI
jgi:hypothetical protein